MSKMRKIIFLILITSCIGVKAQNNYVDSTFRFGFNGTISGHIDSLIPLHDGAAIVIGKFQNVGLNITPNIFKFKNTGLIDIFFNFSNSYNSNGLEGFASIGALNPNSFYISLTDSNLSVNGLGNNTLINYFKLDGGLRRSIANSFGQFANNLNPSAKLIDCITNYQENTIFWVIHSRNNSNGFYITKSDTNGIFNLNSEASLIQTNTHPFKVNVLNNNYFCVETKIGDLDNNEGFVYIFNMLGILVGSFTTSSNIKYLGVDGSGLMYYLEKNNTEDYLLKRRQRNTGILDFNYTKLFLSAKLGGITASKNGLVFYSYRDVDSNGNLINSINIIDQDGNIDTEENPPIITKFFHDKAFQSLEGQYVYFTSNESDNRLPTSKIIRLSSKPVRVRASEKLNGIKVYPNPFDQKIYIEANNKNFNIEEIQIINSKGNLILAKKMYAENEIMLDILPGIYIVKVISSNNQFIYRIIKE
jgi:hypothetical protein